MVPDHVSSPLERFPLTASGKVDRKALPRAGPAPGRSSGRPFVAPRSALQRIIAEQWRQILDLDRVGVHDRFFELGGTSLQAARFVNQMQTELGETIFVFTLFGAPSVAEYAAFLEREFPAAVAHRLRDGQPTGTPAADSHVATPDVDRPRSDVPAPSGPIQGEASAIGSGSASGRRVQARPAARTKASCAQPGARVRARHAASDQDGVSGPTRGRRRVPGRFGDR